MAPFVLPVVTGIHASSPHPARGYPPARVRRKGTVLCGRRFWILHSVQNDSWRGYYPPTPARGEPFGYAQDRPVEPRRGAPFDKLRANGYQSTLRVSLSNHARDAPFDKLRANGVRVSGSFWILHFVQNDSWRGYYPPKPRSGRTGAKRGSMRNVHNTFHKRKGKNHVEAIGRRV